MSVKFSNNGHSTLAASITSSGTSITVASGHGSRFPSLSSGEYFYATLIDSSNNLEIVKCTSRSSDVLTVTRAQESTTARAYAIGDRIELRVTAQGLVDATAIANNSIGADELNVSGNGSSGQYLESDGDGSFSWSAITMSGRLINSTQLLHNTNYTLSASGATEFATGTNLSYTPNESTSTVIAHVECGMQGIHTTSDNDLRINVRVGSVNSSGTTIYTTSENSNQEPAFGNTNNAVNAGTFFAIITKTVKCERTSGGDVVIKVQSKTDNDPNCSAVLINTLITFLEYSA